jgi:hypothetical protein
MKTAVELITNSQNASVETKLLLLALKVDELTEELKQVREQNKPIDTMPRFRYFDPKFHATGSIVD